MRSCQAGMWPAGFGSTGKRPNARRAEPAFVGQEAYTTPLFGPFLALKQRTCSKELLPVLGAQAKGQTPHRELKLTPEVWKSGYKHESSQLRCPQGMRR